MKLNYKTAIGIDICKGFVSTVHLEKKGHKIILTGCSRVATGKGQSCDDNSKSLANAVKKPKSASYLQHFDTGLCFCSSPELLQILNLPDNSPDTAVKFIHEEIRQYAVLPLKDIQIDYCALRGTSSTEQKRVLVGAAQAQPLALMTKELGKNRFDIQSVEPAIVALIRACYNKVIKSAGRKNIMFVLLRDDNMSLCVFSGQKFDFLRTKKFDFDIVNSADNAAAIAEQIESVVQFYEIEKVSDQKDWPVFLTCCSETSKTNEFAGQIKSSLHYENIEISVIDASHTDIICEGPAGTDFSPVAAGAAMKLLDVNDSGININLLPNEISEIRKSRIQLVVIANIAAVILVLVFMYIALLSQKTTKIKNELSQKKESQLNINIPQLIQTRADVNSVTEQITKNIDALDTALKDKKWRNWALVLAEVCTKAPQTVQIKDLRSQDSSKLEIEGMAINYSAINDFVNKLTSCKTISSAQLADAKQNTQYGNGLIDYSIICTLTE
ncbi:MAG: PilN domain-containing protein [Phycisphaerae bacterium]|jgi:Tfp pilus assembly protein PilN